MQSLTARCFLSSTPSILDAKKHAISLVFYRELADLEYNGNGLSAQDDTPTAR